MDSLCVAASPVFKTNPMQRNISSLPVDVDASKFERDLPRRNTFDVEEYKSNVNSLEAVAVE